MLPKSPVNSAGGAPPSTRILGMAPAPPAPAAPPPNGWYKPIGSGLHHFFTRHVAICGKHLASPHLPRLSLTDVPGPEICRACLAELARALKGYSDFIETP